MNVTWWSIGMWVFPIRVILPFNIFKKICIYIYWLAVISHESAAWELCLHVLNHSS